MGRVLAEERHAGLMPLISSDSYPASPLPAYAPITLSPGYHVIPVCLCVETTLCFWRACSVQFQVTSTQSSCWNTKSVEEVQSLEWIGG